jgi:hypothetical protein
VAGYRVSIRPGGRTYRPNASTAEHEREARQTVPVEGTTLDEYNELAYDECKRLASLIEGAVDDECLEYYEAGTWLKDIYFATGQWANAEPPGFTCYE